MRYLIVSQPKAGTYLCANLLQELGLVNSFLHIFPNRYIRRDSDNWSSDTFHNVAEVESDLATGLDLIPDNTFALTHVSFHQSGQLLDNFKKILVTRNYDDAKQSNERFQSSQGVEVKKFTSARFDNILKWKKYNDVFHITFNDLINKNIELIDKLQTFIFGSVITDSMTAINNALLKDSPTKSSIRD